MHKKPLIVGAKGSMGRRYTAILRSLGIEPLLMDLGDPIPVGFDSVIITTPTDKHVEHIEQFAPMGVPILCEKPIATNLGDAVRACKAAKEARIPLRMVNQYAFLPCLSREADETSYDHYNHGRDGLAWDCISLIALAKSHVRLSDKSPEWRCRINGERIHLNDVYIAYVHMISSWLYTDFDGFGTPYILSAHAKVEEYLEINA